jgi:hypothetical protein
MNRAVSDGQSYGPWRPGYLAVQYGLLNKLFVAVAAAFWLFVTQETAAPQEWPQRQIRMIVSFGPGGGDSRVGAGARGWRQAERKGGRPAR